VHDAEPAQQFLDRGVDPLGFLSEQVELVGVAQQGQRAEREHIGGGLVTGEQQQEADADELVGGQVVAMLADQHAEQLLARVGLGSGDEIGHVRTRLLLHREPLLEGPRHVQHAAGPPLEVRPVGVRHAEQFADHQRRDRQRERRHQVHR
jgi:hypothetical protein